MGGMFFWAKASYTSFRPNASHISRWVYIQCCKMLHAKERLQQTQKPSFLLCQLTLTYKKQASTNFFPVDSHDTMVFRHRCKNWSETCIVWPIGVAFKNRPKNTFFLRVSTRFLRVSCEFENLSFFFWNPVFYGSGQYFYALQRLFLPVLNSTIKKT